MGTWEHIILGELPWHNECLRVLVREGGGEIPQNIHIEINKKGVVYVIIMVATFASWTPSSFIHSTWMNDG
jgi:hypothetical protein